MDKLQELLDLFTDEPWLRAGVIIVLAFVAAFVIDWTVGRVLRVLTRRTTTAMDDRLLAMFHRPIQVTVVMLGIQLAVLQLELTEHDAEGVVVGTDWEFLIRGLLFTILVIVWAIFAMRFTALMLGVLSKDTKRFQVIEPTTLPLFENLAKVLVMVLGVYFLIKAWDADVSAFLASAGIAGLAIGFAAKDTLSNLFAGVFILADAPYRMGDFIVLDSGERGEVVHIGLRSTRLLTRDDIEVTIPNSAMGAAKILNESSGRHLKRRVRAKVGVAYGSDVDLVREMLMEVADEEEMVCKDPEPRVRFRLFGTSSLDFELLCWIPEPVLRGRAVDALLTGIYKKFAEKKIEIAFPQLDLHMHRS